MIDYQRTGANQKMDFRYTSEAVDLDPDAPSVDTILLEEADIIPYRVCYSFASTAYNMLASCAGMATGGSKSYDNDGDGVNDAWEYGYFGAKRYVRQDSPDGRAVHVHRQ